MLKQGPMLVAVLCLLFFFSGLVIAADDAEDQPVQVKIADPYIELHTGPGRGYPIFYVVDRGDLIELLKRKTDWFLVRYYPGEADRDDYGLSENAIGDESAADEISDENNAGEQVADEQEANVIEGWVHREQMQATLTPEGEAVEFIDVDLGDFSGRRWSAGMMGGSFNGIPVMTVFGAYSPVPTLSFELSISQAIGEFTSSDIYNLNVSAQPFPRWRFSPYFTLGMGQIVTTPRTTLIQAPDTDDLMAHVGIGINTYITRRFMFRAEYKDYVAFSSDDNNEEFEEWKVGFAFFF